MELLAGEQDPTDEKSILVQVMAWCRQATSHYPSQCWPRSMSPYGVNRPQWVKLCAEYCVMLPKPRWVRQEPGLMTLPVDRVYPKQVSFKKEVGVMVNDLVFWLTVWLNFENVLLTFKWYVFMWQNCSMLTKYANCHLFNKWKCVSMPLLCYDISMNKTRFYPLPSIMSFLIIYSCQFKFLSTFF